MRTKMKLGGELKGIIIIIIIIIIKMLKRRQPDYMWGILK